MRTRPKPGPQIDRQNSAPIGGADTLIDPSIYQMTPRHAAGAALQDSEAKKPGAAASVREAPAAPGSAKQG